jgi:hypothetical protein
MSRYIVALVNGNAQHIDTFDQGFRIVLEEEQVSVDESGVSTKQNQSPVNKSEFMEENKDLYDSVEIELLWEAFVDNPATKKSVGGEYVGDVLVGALAHQLVYDGDPAVVEADDDDDDTDEQTDDDSTVDPDCPSTIPQARHTAADEDPDVESLSCYTPELSPEDPAPEDPAPPEESDQVPEDPDHRFPYSLAPCDIAMELFADWPESDSHGEPRDDIIDDIEGPGISEAEILFGPESPSDAEGQSKRQRTA